MFLDIVKFGMVGALKSCNFVMFLDKTLKC